ncbi:hypothetical protein BDN72DRAFT_815321 [Pluteus cervinus]|uniref:Uncharacterized protein n=1 Tax=Pluteus cervinus TaxID=181527 RepID=A0ACD3B4F6_9AGAR|nr:hypothetical protein BDN72DRAFT_815321 [Pluteus cervinus]
MNDQYYSYSWHQSHDQATVLVMVPYDTQEEDLLVAIERNHLIAGVRGHAPTVKGRLYGTVDALSSSWQLEPRASHLSARERTTSTTSTTSTPSSFAFVSDPETSSSFAASLESGQVSEAEDTGLSSGLSSPGPPRARGVRRSNAHSAVVSRSVSPANAVNSMASSYSSLESLHSPKAGRLLTLYLEKDQSIIWPCLISGPVPEATSPILANSVIYNSSEELEHQYNMDPTSLVLIALELFDIRKEKDEAFEYFIRAWHQAQVPSSTVRLVSHYLPLHLPIDQPPSGSVQQRGTLPYYLNCVGGTQGLAQLYLAAGMLHLEGAASSLLSSSYSSLSSIRLPVPSQPNENTTASWRRDREAAIRYFEHAKALNPALDIPTLPENSGSEELEMPTIDIPPSTGATQSQDIQNPEPEPSTTRRRRKKAELVVLEKQAADDLESTWYLQIPGLVGAGTALLVVGIVGALSLSNWSRRSQGS